MNESTEIANAIYYLASTLKEGVCLLGFFAMLIWIGSVLLSSASADRKTGK